MSYRQQSKRAAFARRAKGLRQLDAFRRDRDAARPNAGKCVTLHVKLPPSLEAFSKAAQRAATAMTEFGEAIEQSDAVVMPDGRRLSIRQAMAERIASLAHSAGGVEFVDGKPV